MEALNVVFIIIFLILVGIYFFYLFLIKRKKHFTPTNSLIAYEINLENQKVYLMKNTIIANKIFTFGAILTSDGRRLNSFLASMPNNISKWIRSLIHKFEVETSESLDGKIYKYQTTHTTTKSKYLLNLIATRNLRNKIQISIYYKKMSTRSKVTQIELKEKKFISENDQSRTLSIAMQWNGKINIILFRKAIKLILKTLKVKNYAYEYENSILYITVELLKSDKSYTKAVKNLYKAFQNDHLNIDIYNLTSGQSILLSSAIKNELMLKRAKEAHSFLLYQSIISKKTILADHAELWEKQKFIDFKIAQSKFREEIKSDQIASIRVTVRTNKSFSSIGHYLFPTLKNINNDVVDKLILLNYNKKILSNLHANLVSKYVQQEKSIFLINVSLEWIIENKNKILNKSVIYVLPTTRESDFERLNEIALEMEKEGIYVAFKVNNSTTSRLLLLTDWNFKFVIIENDLIGEIQNSKYVDDIISISKIAQMNVCNIIYQIESKKIDSHLKEIINFEYYYEPIKR
ncbi:MAG: hypothetical protein NC236_00255 [Mycoplasma sp.]|nr:hypothetical protein [Mycoplasma sp.]